MIIIRPANEEVATKRGGAFAGRIMGENDTPARGIMDLRPPAGLLKLPAGNLSCLKATISCQRAEDR